MAPTPRLQLFAAPAVAAMNCCVLPQCSLRSPRAALAFLPLFGFESGRGECVHCCLGRVLGFVAQSEAPVCVTGAFSCIAVVAFFACGRGLI